jgi:CRP/FNR family transcriptional regulator, polysaccharide utilization system transcription regulator
MTEQKRDIEQLVTNLNERKKELECLYKIDDILKDFNLDIEAVFKLLVGVIPAGWRYPDICGLRIRYDETLVESEGFKTTDLKQSAELKVDDVVVGEIVLCYIKPIRSEKGVFLNEENRLFTTITEKINQYLSFRQLKDNFEKSKKRKLDTTDDSFTKWLSSLHLTEAEIGRISTVKVHFKKGETICKQGSFASFIMIIKEGLVKASIESSQYKSHVFKITKPFSIIGLSSLYGDEYYHFSVTALVPSTMYLVERASFDNIVKINKRFGFEMMKQYSNSLQNVYDKLGSIANKQALGRVCDALLYLSEKVFESNTIENAVSRKDMAELAGMSTENLVRILSELKKDKIVLIKNRGIEILDKKTLVTLSNIG